MKLYQGPWVWTKEAPFGEFWKAPVGCRGAVDLRTLSAQGKKGIAEGAGLFVMDSELPSPYVLLSEDESQFAKITFDKLTKNTCPIGKNGCKPLRPDKDMNLSVSIGQFKHTEELNRSGEHWEKLVESIQADVKKLHNTNGKTVAEKNLGFLNRQYGVNESVFVPSGLTLKAMKPETTITESFNKANGPLGPDLSWTQFPTDDSNALIDVVSDEANAASTSVFPNAWARAETALSSADHYSKVTVTTMSIGSGIYTSAGSAVRISSDITSSTMDFYYAQLYSNSGVKQVYIQKCVNGVRTIIAQNLSYAYSLPVVFKLDATGSTITLTDGVTQVFQITDTAVTTGVKAAIYLYRNSTGDTARLDTFEASDGLNSFVPRIMLLGVG